MENQILKLILFVIFLFSGTFANCQDEKLYPSNRFLFQIYYDHVQFPFINYDYYKNDQSYRIGGEISYYLTNRFSITSGINYEKKKYYVDRTHSTTWAVDLIMETYSLSYVAFPIIIGFDLLQNKSHNLIILLGSEIQNIRLKETYLYYDNGYSIKGEDNLISDYINCLSLGISYNYFLTDVICIGLCPKLRYDFSGESTSFSYLLRFSFGYMLSAPTP